MPKNLNPIRKAKLKKSLLQGKSIRQSLLDSNYSATTAHSKANSTTNRYVRVCMEEIAKEFDMAKITPQYVISKVEAISNDPEASHSDKLRANELLGKFLALWKDKNINENINPERIQIVYANTLPSKAIDRRTEGNVKRLEGIPQDTTREKIEHIEEQIDNKHSL